MSVKPDLLKTVTHKDPNSGKDLIYRGYSFKTLISITSKKMKLKSISSLKFIAKDGYVTNVSLTELEARNAFLAIDVSGFNKKGIFNKSLNKHFDWKPGYLIFLKKSKGFKSSSPYQITEIIFEKDNNRQSIINKTPKEFKAGAITFLNTCNKCHSYKNYGGLKAPRINVLTGFWPNEKKLKKFLREPQKTLGKKIEMSGFKGSERSLDGLIQFLRWAEDK